MTQFELPKELSKLLDPPENLNILNVEACNQLMDKIICFYGMTGQPDLADKLLPAYQIYRGKVHPALRFQTYQNVVDLVIKEEIGLHGLLPFLCGDVDPTIVSSAALDYIVLCPVEQNDAMRGPNVLLEMIDEHVFLNPMAVISGLLMSGDSRVLVLLVPIRKKLNCDQVEQLTQLRPSMLTTALIDFYLSWLEETDSASNPELFGLLAACFANLSLSCSEQVAYDIERFFPSKPNQAINILQKWPLAEYAKTFESRLRALAVQEQGEPVIPEVMQAWGLSAYKGK